MRRTTVVVVAGLLAVLLTAEPLVARPTDAVSVPPARGAAAFRSQVLRIPPHIRDVMRGSSWRPGCPVGFRDLRLVRVTHHGFDGQDHMGRLVVHRRWAHAFERVFRRLYHVGFPIRRMRLVDRYGAVDMRSMQADNTSAFNCRYRDGVCCSWSMHAFGKAIDINPVENPYVYRGRRRKGMIFVHDEVWWAFHAIGWEWGGTWSSSRDYQHFSHNGR